MKKEKEKSNQKIGKLFAILSSEFIN